MTTSVMPLPEPLNFLVVGLGVGSLIVLLVHLVLDAIDRRRGAGPSGEE